MFEILFIVFENVKTLDRKTIWKIRVGIVLYTKNFFQNSQKLDQSGEGNTTFFFLAFVSSVASKANVTDNKQKLVFYNLTILSTEQSTNCKPTHTKLPISWHVNSKQTLLVNFSTSQHQNKNVNPNKLFLPVNFSKPTYIKTKNVNSDKLCFSIFSKSTSKQKCDPVRLNEAFWGEYQ